MPGYRPAVAEGITPVSLQFLCFDCRLILRDAVQTAEGTRLCESCYVQSKNNAQLAAVVKKCNRDKAARREVASLFIQCDYAAAGCTWVGQVIEFQQQHLFRCQYFPVLCHNSDCGITVPRNRLEQHEILCPMKLVTCEYCGIEVQFCNLGLHWELYSESHMLYNTDQDGKNPFESRQLYPFQAPYGPPGSSDQTVTTLTVEEDPLEACSLWQSPIQEQGRSSAGEIVTVHIGSQTIHQNILVQQQYKSTAEEAASNNT